MFDGDDDEENKEDVCFSQSWVRTSMRTHVYEYVCVFFLAPEGMLYISEQLCTKESSI